MRLAAQFAFLTRTPEAKEPRSPRFRSRLKRIPSTAPRRAFHERTGLPGVRMEKNLELKKRDRQISTGMAIMALLAIIGLGVIIARIFIAAVYLDARRNVADQIDRSTKIASSGLYTKISIVAALAEKAPEFVRNADDEAGFRSMAERAGVFRDTGIFTGIGVADPNGKLYGFGENAGVISRNQSFRRALAGKTIISNPAYAHQTGERIVVFYAPIFRDDAVIGVIAATQTTANLEKYFTQSFYHGYGQCSFVDGTGNVILRPNGSDADETFTNVFSEIRRFIGNRKKANEQIDTMRDDFRTDTVRIVEITDSHRNGRMVGYGPLPDYPDWFIVCTIDKRAISAISFNLVGKVFLFEGYLLLLLAILFLVLLKVRKKTKEDLYRIAYIDETTGGYNFNYFRTYAPIIADRESRYIIMRFDIKHFTYINESFGRETGDLILRAVNDCLESMCAESSRQLAARVINDEFIVLRRDGDLKDRDPAREILKELYKIPKRLRISCNLQFYAGACRVLGTDRTMEKAIDFSAIALKRYERATVNREYLFDGSMAETNHIEEVIEENMERALEAGEFLVYLQPKVDIKTGKPVNAEALIRWDSRNFGFMPPSDFVPLFERNGFIQKLDFYVLDTVCGWIRAETAETGRIVPVSVNQSRLHCYNPDYIARIIEIVSRHGIPFSAIEFEITESVIVENIEVVARTIVALRALGFRISIDDFGSGYTSLNFLRTVDVDVIKIDKTLVDDAETSRKRRVMLEHIIAMSHELSLEVVCEGVETADQVEMLRRMGCDIIQGYYFSPPLSHEAYRAYLER